jgi:phosphatidylserine/phosphatidylglycerophosphate/cardiolipin synthase-like enzyme
MGVCKVYRYRLLCVLVLLLGLASGYLLCYIQLQPEIGRLSSVLEAMSGELASIEEARLELMDRLLKLEETLDLVSGEYLKLRGSVNITVKLIPDRSYFEEAYRLISDARNSVYLVMYLAENNPVSRDNPANLLVDMLIAAHLRGVDVRIIFDEGVAVSYPETIARLKSYGVRVRLDGDRNAATHAKLLVVDRFYVLAGSHDWIEDSLNRNYEYSIMLASHKYGSEAAYYAEDMWSRGYDI